MDLSGLGQTGNLVTQIIRSAATAGALREAARKTSGGRRRALREKAEMHSTVAQALLRELAGILKLPKA